MPKIRNLAEKDIPTCLKIAEETEVTSNRKEAEKIMKLSLSPGIHFLNPNYYVLEDNGAIIGISGLYYDYEDPKKVMWLDYLAVSEKFQNKGYGTMLLQNLEKIAKEKSVKMLCVFTDRQPAVDFYQEKGFKVCGKIENYYGKNKPKTWLYKNI